MRSGVRLRPSFAPLLIHWNRGSMSTRTISECLGFLFLLGIFALGYPNFAGAQQAGGATEAEERGSVIVFPKFTQGMERSNNGDKPQTELEVRAQCPRGATCTEN